jgi:drug/metabolite transporter (DMT)-like permease
LSTLVLFAVLLSAIFHATWNAIVKAQRNHQVASEVLAVFAGIFALPFMIALPLPANVAWPYIAISALIHVGYVALVGFAYRNADLGVAYPLTRGTAPLLTSIAALIFVGETPHLAGWFAILAITSGILVLSIDALRRGGLSRAAAIAVITNAFVIMSYTLIDGLGARLAGDSLAYSAWMIAGTSTSVLILSLAMRGKKFIREGKKMWWPCLIAGALLLPAYGTALWAMTQAPIGLVAALRETSVLFAAVIGYYVFGEHFGPRRWLAVVLIVAGIIVLNVG